MSKFYRIKIIQLKRRQLVFWTGDRKSHRDKCFQSIGCGFLSRQSAFLSETDRGQLEALLEVASSGNCTWWSFLLCTRILNSFPLTSLQFLYLLIQTMLQLERHHYKRTDCLLLWDVVVVGLVFLFWDESISHWGWILSNWAFLATSWQFLTFTTNDYASLQCWGQASDN